MWQISGLSENPPEATGVATFVVSSTFIVGNKTLPSCEKMCALITLICFAPLSLPAVTV